MTGSIIGPARKKIKLNNLKKKKITGSIIGPAMAGPTGPFATALLTQVSTDLHTDYAKNHIDCRCRRAHG